MADVTLNTVLDGGHEPRVGDRYEITPGKWFVLVNPTQRVQKAFFEAMGKVEEARADVEAGKEYKGPSDVDVLKTFLEGDFNFSEENILMGVAQKAIMDFFILLSQINKRLDEGFPRLSPS